MTAPRAVCHSGPLDAQDQPRRSGVLSAQERFLHCLATMAIDAHHVAMPEYYSADAAYADLPRYAGRHVHLIFRATDGIRLLKRGYNIAYFAWRSPALEEPVVAGEHPFSDQKRMLGLCDEIWVPCSFTKGVVERHGLANVHVVPAPVVVSTRPKRAFREALSHLGHLPTQTLRQGWHAGAASRHGAVDEPFYASVTRHRAPGSAGKIYLSIVETSGPHVDLDAMIRGFDGFVQAGRSDILLLKLPPRPDGARLDEAVREILAPGSAFDCDNIIVLDAALSLDEMSILYDLADFYLCTSRAEEQNLPMIEAMARGVVPITPRHTAMLDYIEPTNALVVAGEPGASGGEGRGVPDVNICTPGRVMAALDVSASLPAATYARLSGAASETVRMRYAEEAVSRLLAARLSSGGL